MNAFIEAVPWQSLAMMLFFVFYCEAVVQVLKQWQWLNDKLLSTTGACRIAVFVVAWIFGGAAGYGMLANILGIQSASEWLRILDCMGTAAVVSRFSGMTYDQMEALLAKINAKKEQHRNSAAPQQAAG